MTTGILASVKMKNNLYKDYLKDPTDQKLQIFKQYQNRLNKIKRYAEISYYEKEFDQIKGNMKKSWTKINEVLRHKKEKEQIKKMTFGDEIVNKVQKCAMKLLKDH